MNQNIRLEMLIGPEGLSKLRRARVAVFGLGGVGGYVVEALARAGVGTLEIIDNDRIALSNLNRQILALHSTLNQTKVEAAAARVRDIDPTITVHPVQAFYLPNLPNSFDFGVYDYVVDCIDTVTAKLDLVMQCRAVGTPIISALGTGNKLDPTRLEVADIYETAVCPLARIMRKELRRRGVERLKVVYSREEPRQPLFQPEPEPRAEIDPPGGTGLGDNSPGGNGAVASNAGKNGVETDSDNPEAYGNNRRSVPGSSPFVPPAAGLILASAVVREILEK